MGYKRFGLLTGYLNRNWIKDKCSSCFRGLNLKGILLTGKRFMRQRSFNNEY